MASAVTKTVHCTTVQKRRRQWLPGADSPESFSRLALHAYEVIRRVLKWDRSSVAPTYAPVTLSGPHAEVEDLS